MRTAMRSAKNRLFPAMPIVKPGSNPIPAKNTAPNPGAEALTNERPMDAGSPLGVKDAGEIKIQRIAKADPDPGGGGSPAPGIVLGGSKGAPGPEAPPEDIVFNGGGAGGTNLPKAAPRIGGGGGNSILSVENPLAKDAVPDEKPGLGPGRAGGQGIGAGGGVGTASDKGIGTGLTGVDALATLKSKPGSGIGAGAGSGLGTKPPGRGKGTGAELPGTGGSGTGYGHGSGIGMGDGTGTGIGHGRGTRVGLTRGVPFGDISGILKSRGGGGGGGGGGGSESRGSVFGTTTNAGKDRALHIVYLLDVSGSMNDGNKIGKAKEALKQALSELKPKDTFNIVTFYASVRAFSDSMVPATSGNIDSANLFVDFATLKDGTNIEAAFNTAFTMDKITHIFILSDGEPTKGQLNFSKIRARVLEQNSSHAQVMALALGLGERFPGMALLKGLAEDNDGKYSYVNLRNR